MRDQEKENWLGGNMITEGDIPDKLFTLGGNLPLTADTTDSKKTEE